MFELEVSKHCVGKAVLKHWIGDGMGAAAFTLTDNGYSRRITMWAQFSAGEQSSLQTSGAITSVTADGFEYLISEPTGTATMSSGNAKVARRWPSS
jgi:hypothetical protein